MLKNNEIKVSVCVPVCGTQEYLVDCLKSIGDQQFEDFEVVIVEDEIDNPQKKALEKLTQKILKEFKKLIKGRRIFVQFIKHDKNRGLVEARRSAVLVSKGKYLMFVDSDDTLKAGAIKTLWQTATESGAEIVHGTAEVCFCGDVLDKNYAQKRKDVISKKCERVFYGKLSGAEILKAFLVEKSCSGFLWAKLFERELCLKAFERIPFVYCTFGEDFLTFFYLALFAKTYEGIPAKVYNYTVNTGISSAKKIDSLEEWKKVCSTASVFTIILNDIQNDEQLRKILTEEEILAVKTECRFFAKNNLQQLNAVVVPELKESAQIELCEWWGSAIIESAEKELCKKD